ncbi:MAG: rhodanese-like domain-containing protein [Gammaproteobacteria bacterium]|nr:rhodanese-like domain-containing protein [Gammaproteobacteria bacterium]
METAPALPLIVEPGELESNLGTPHLLVVDLSRPEVHQQLHVPGAMYLDYGALVAARPPVAGLLPDAEHLTAVMSTLAVTPDTHVVAYDDEGGGKAGRLLWTLDAVGHHRWSLLNGGLHAWANEGHPTAVDIVEPEPRRRDVTIHPDFVADADWIMARLADPAVACLDSRAPDEFSGTRRYSARGGHIPGAVNMDWVRAMDPARNLRLRPAPELLEELAALGVVPDKEVVVYCQTHHRSSHTYVMLKALGFDRVRGYHGAWSEWGNRDDTPVEVETR